MLMAVIGDEEFVLGFRLAGIREVYETTPDAYETTFQKALDRRDVGVLVALNDDLLAIRPSVRQRALDSIRPVVVAIGHTDVSGLRERIRSAIGVEL